jgi:TRAP-type mannitol/chloroaromatic compound transport system permease large subunit
MPYLFLAVFAVLMCFGIPIAIALGGSALAYFLLKGDVSLTVLVQTTYGGLASFPLVAIPLLCWPGF